MKVCVVGGLCRMEKEYKSACVSAGCRAKVFTKQNNSFDEALKCAECVVLLTKLSSHNMASKAKKICKKFSIPIICLDKTSPASVGFAVKDFLECDTCTDKTKCWGRYS